MDKEIKEKWLKALRSGKYEQGVEVLCRLDNKGTARYCCLGVLIEVVEGEDAWDAFRGLRYSRGLSRFPSLVFLRSVGLDHKLADHLSVQNDRGATFEQLADIIEEQA